MITLNEVLEKQIEAQKSETESSKSLADSFPCPEGDIFTLPTRADITNAFNEIASMPGELTASFEESKSKREKEIAELEGLKINPDLTEEQISKIDIEIEKKENFIQTALVEGVQKEIKEVQTTIEDFVETLETALSPYWAKTEDKQNRDWQKEAKDAFEELLADFHTYIPTKIAELLSKLVPFDFNINIMGLSINILKLVTSPSYRTELQEQLAGKSFVIQIKAKQKEFEELSKKLKEQANDLTTDEEELIKIDEKRDKLQEEIDSLYVSKKELVDKFFKLIPEEFRQFDGEFGVVDDEAKAKLAWKYIKTEIKEWIQNAHIKAFEKLISVFKKIWKALGLPSLPFGELIAIMNMDIGALIEAKIKSLKEKFKQTKLGKIKQINVIKKEIEDLKIDLEIAGLDSDTDNYIKLSEQLEKKEEQKRKLEDDLLKEVKDFHQGVLDAVSEIEIFGYDILKIIGGKIKSTTESIEEKIAEICLEFQDFKLNWHKKILFEWVKLVKKFFNAIGLGGIFKLLFLTWCDFLKLIGMPFTIPAIAGVAGVLSTGQKTTPIQPRPNTSKESDLGAQFTIGEEPEQKVYARTNETTGAGTLKVFLLDANNVSGVEEITSEVSISDGQVTFSDDLLMETGETLQTEDGLDSFVSETANALTVDEFDRGLRRNVSIILV
jgi:hypothetical protein